MRHLNLGSCLNVDLDAWSRISFFHDRGKFNCAYSKAENGFPSLNLAWYAELFRLIRIYPLTMR